MKELIAALPEHLRQALHHIGSHEFHAPDRAIDSVLITGLGGSGIGGTIVSELMCSLAKLPVTVNKNYDIPNFVNPSTLVIACSYSGNTEETLAAVAQAEKRGALIACISSGGALKAFAEKAQLNCLSMEAGHPPRSMFGYSFAFLLYYFEHYGIAPVAVSSEVSAAAQLLDQERESILAEAEKVAQALQNTIPQILACAGNTGVAARWRQQLNENSKMLGWEAEVPEMNHNELVGWEGGDARFSALFLRRESDHPRNQKRMEIIKEIIGKKSPHLAEVWAKGDSDIQRALYLIHLGDWVSYYLSKLNQVDIIDIKSIDYLKSTLSKIPL